MKKMKILSLLLCLLLLVQPLHLSAGAAAEAGIGGRTDRSSAAAGEEIHGIFSLECASSQSDIIEGIQLDVKGFDPSILLPRKCTSLIVDAGALSNSGSYLLEKDLVRFTYFNRDNPGLLLNSQDIFDVAFQVSPAVKENGVQILQLRLLVQLSSGEQITKTGSLEVAYTAEKPAVLDISWGSMEFTYENPIWNPSRHVYEGGGWNDHGTGYVSVTSREGTVDVEYVYESLRSEIAGSFLLGAEKITKPVTIGAGETQKVNLVLTGVPAESLSGVKIGTVTVRIGGN